jgi:hypothetical protein
VELIIFSETNLPSFSQLFPLRRFSDNQFSDLVFWKPEVQQEDSAKQRTLLLTEQEEFASPERLFFLVIRTACASEEIAHTHDLYSPRNLEIAAFTL